MNLKLILSTSVLFFLLSFKYVLAADTYQIGAWYFPMWNPIDVVNEPSLNSIANPGCQATYGRSNDPWCGIRDFFDGNTQGWTGDFSHLKPSIGYYNDAQSSTYEKHIKQAKQNGLTYFNFYYYWDHPRHQELLKSSMDAFLAARNKNDIKFILTALIFPTAENYHTEIVTNIVNKYFTQSNYLKVNDRPLFVLGDLRALDNPQGFVDKLNATSQNVLGKKPYLVAMDWGIPSSLNVDGYTCLNDYIFTLAHPEDMIGDYQRYINAIPDNHTTKNKPYMTCATQAFDERPRVGIVPWIPRDRIRYVTNSSVEKFRQAVVKEKAFMDSRSDPLSKMMTVYAWNEWHEGGILEPNIKDKAGYLNVLADVFNLTKGTDPCRISGECSWDAPLTSDLNTDRKVDIFDYNILVSKFGNPYTIFDYNQLVANFGKSI